MTLAWLQHTLSETRISLAKRKRLLFGKRTEKAPRQPPPDPTTDSGDGQRAAPAGTDVCTHIRDAPPGERDTGVTQAAEANAPAADPVAPGRAGTAAKPPPPGHSRLGAADYPGATVQACAQEHLTPGERCPACGGGRLFVMAPLVRLRSAASRWWR